MALAEKDIPGMKRLTPLFAYCLLASLYTSQSYAEISRPYKVIDGKLAYQKYGNQEPVFLENAREQDFEIVYKGDKFSVAFSADRFYCNGSRLEQRFTPSEAVALGPFLVSGDLSYAYCNKTEHPINADTLEALNNPFFRDKDHVFTSTGQVLKGADPQKIRTQRAQAFDDRQYYFVAHTTIIRPYSSQVVFYDNCYGWASIDGKLHFEGQQKPSTDDDSFRCLDPDTAIDKDTIYFFGEAKYHFSTPVKTSDIRQIQNSFFTDGQNIWYTRLAPMQLTGLDVERVAISGNEISDGKTTWQCANIQTNDQPICQQTSETSKSLRSLLKKLRK